MLFRSLIDRLLGTTEASGETLESAARPTRLSYDRYPGLVNVLLDLLATINPKTQGEEVNEGSDVNRLQMAAERVFPVLEMLRRAAPPPAYQDRVEALLLEAMSNHNWHIRDMAARTYAAVTLGHDLVSLVESVRPDATASQNSMHGRLLCLKYLLQKSRMGQTSSLICK